MNTLLKISRKNKMGHEKLTVCDVNYQVYSEDFVGENFQQKENWLVFYTEILI